MASKSLTKYEKEFVVNNFLQRINAKINNLLEIYAKDVINPLVLSKTPNEVLALDKKFPKLINKTDGIYFYQLAKISYSSEVSFYIKIENWFEKLYSTDKLISALRETNNPSTTKNLIDNVLALINEKKSIKGKMTCILDDINTTKQLKDQFPEAYDILIYQEAQSESSATENKCDSIENLRAQLSKYK